MKLSRRIIPAIALSTAFSSCGDARHSASVNESLQMTPRPDFSPPVIALSPDLVDEVRTGKETATIRKGHRDYVIGPAVFDANYTKIPILITALQYKRFEDLDDQDAKLDGDISKDALKASLKTYYPTMESNDEFTIVHFELRHENQP
jgi:hypothetical protein